MDIQVPQIIFQLINFSVVLGALTYLLYGPIVKILEERSKQIEAGQKAAQAALSEQAAIEETKKQIIKTAEKEAAEIRESARTDAKAVIATAREQAKGEAEKVIEGLTADWQSEKMKHVAEMRNQFVETVIAAASKVVGETLDAKKHQQLIDTELETLLKKT